MQRTVWLGVFRSSDNNNTLGFNVDTFEAISQDVSFKSPPMSCSSKPVSPLELKSGCWGGLGKVLRTKFWLVFPAGLGDTLRMRSWRTFRADLEPDDILRKAWSDSVDGPSRPPASASVEFEFVRSKISPTAKSCTRWNVPGCRAAIRDCVDDCNGRSLSVKGDRGSVASKN